MNKVSLANIRKAFHNIDPCFINTPQFKSEGLSRVLQATIISKVETMNPIGCFKGRGINWWIKSREINDVIVCATAGNLGQALAYESKQSNLTVHLFVSKNANPYKLDAMKRFGVKNLHICGNDFDEAKGHAITFAKKNGFVFLEDGKDAEITEGLGTIGLELERYSQSIDKIYVPIGNGALINGVGAWYKSKRPSTKVVGVCAENAPSMQLSWKYRKRISTESVNTIADGIAVKEPVEEALALLQYSVDEIVLVSEASILSAMQMYFDYERILVEPSGAVSLAAAVSEQLTNKGLVIGTLITGSNIDPVLKDLLINNAKKSIC